MKAIDNIEHLKFCINRYDHFYDSVNNKSALFLAINTFIVGGLLAVYPDIRNSVDCGKWINTIYFSVIAAGLISILITLWAAIPYLGKPTNSNIYFRAIANKSLDEFSSDLKGVTDSELAADYTEQTYALSKGLNNKFKTLQIAGYFIAFEFFLSIPLIILLANNIKQST